MEPNLPPRLLPSLLATRSGASLPWDAGAPAPPPYTALYCDGTGDYASIADADALTPSGTAMTLAGWIWRPGLGGACVAKGVHPNAEYVVGSAWTFDDQLGVWHPQALPDAGASFVNTPRFSGPATGQWCYIADVLDCSLAIVGPANVGPENRQRLFHGPNDLYTSFTAATYAPNVLEGTGALWFGRNHVDAVVPAHYYHDWCLWSRALSAAELEAHIAGNPSPTGLVRRWFHQRHRRFDDGASYPPVAVADAQFVAMPGPIPRSIKKLACIGDSLTSGQEPDWSAAGSPVGCWRGGWRRLQYDLALARGVQIKGVGQTFTNEGHPNRHDGYPGQQGHSATVVTACQGVGALAPDAVIFNIGTNDIAGAGQPAATVESRIAARFDDMYAGGLSASTPVGWWPLGPLVGGGYADVNAWFIATEAPRHVALGRNVQNIAHTYVAGDNATSDTNVHFSEQGYTNLATTFDAWLAANGC